MFCRNCFLFDQEKLEAQCCFFEDRHSLVLFLLNVILNIQKKWIDFGKCDRTKICSVCQCNIVYRKYQYVIYKNCLNLDFLAEVRENLHKNLSKMIESNNHFLCEIINKKFCYKHKDWFNGNQVHYDLEHCLSLWEKYEMDKIIQTYFKIVCRKIVF